MKTLLASTLLLTSMQVSAYTTETIKQQMIAQGFEIDRVAMKIATVSLAWARPMSKYQCDVYVNSTVPSFQSPVITRENTAHRRIELVMNKPSLLFGCFDNIAHVWLVE